RCIGTPRDRLRCIHLTLNIRLCRGAHDRATMAGRRDRRFRYRNGISRYLPQITARSRLRELGLVEGHPIFRLTAAGDMAAYRLAVSRPDTDERAQVAVSGALTTGLAAHRAGGSQAA